MAEEIVYLGASASICIPFRFILINFSILNIVAIGYTAVYVATHEEGRPLMTNMRTTRVLGRICLLITVIILVAGLWPFNFFARNQVSWSSEGLSFNGRGFAYTRDPLPTTRDPSNKGELTIELALQPARVFSRGVPVILAFDDGQTCERLMIGQWKSHLVIRSRKEAICGNERQTEIGLQNALPAKKQQFITIVSRRSGSSIYLNGELDESNKGSSLLKPDEVISGRLVLGNSASGDLPWTGMLSMLAVYGRSLNTAEVRDHYDAWRSGRFATLTDSPAPISMYLFNAAGGSSGNDLTGSGNHIIVEDRFQPLTRKGLAAPWDDFQPTRSYLQDVCINIAGFVPFGFFLAWYLSERGMSRLVTIVAITALGILISLGIELLQAHLPSRTSQFMDVINNIVGAVIGILLWNRYIFRFRWERRERRPAPKDGLRKKER